MKLQELQQVLSMVQKTECDFITFVNYNGNYEIAVTDYTYSNYMYDIEINFFDLNGDYISTIETSMEEYPLWTDIAQLIGGVGQFL